MSARVHAIAFLGFCAAFLGALAAPGRAHAQEAMYTAAATMPSPGVVVVRPQLNFYQFGANPTDHTDSTQRIDSLTTLQIGLARALSLTLDVPVEFDRRKDASTGAIDHDQGVQDLGLTFKYRVLKKDTGGIDTIRLALLAGAEFASGDNADFSSMSINPQFGAVLTIVRGRHGFNQELSYRINTSDGDMHNVGGGTGKADALLHNTSYLYRLAPEEYTAETKGAWYAKHHPAQQGTPHRDRTGPAPAGADAGVLRAP